MARMSIDDKFLRDARVVLLGRRFGWGRRETMGALLDLFAIAYDREDDVVTAAEIDVTAGEAGFAEALIAEDLGERLAGGVRIKGAADRIEYLLSKREAGRIGGRKSGESRRKRSEAKRSTASPKHEAHGNPPDPVPDVVPAPVPVIPEELSPRAIPPTVVPSTEYDAEDPRSRGRLAEETYRRVSAERLVLAEELLLPKPLPFPPISPSSRAGSFRDLLDRVREEGALAPVVCDRIVANLVAQAREERSIEWLAEKAFGERPWRNARDWTPGAKARRDSRAGPGGSAERAPKKDPRFGRIEPHDPSEYPDGEIPL